MANKNNFSTLVEEAANNVGMNPVDSSFDQDDKNKKKTPQVNPQVSPQEEPEEEYIPTPDEWLDIEGRKHKIPRNLRHSIFGYESGKRQYGKDGKVLTSPKKAEGYTQILPETARGEGYENTSENVYDNISAGVSYLRRGFDMAKEKGYDDKAAWVMAARGYLNGQHRQESNLSDGNVNTGQYENNVLSAWEKRIKELGEREDDWNDPNFLTPLESLEESDGLSEDLSEGGSAGTQLPGEKTLQPTDKPDENKVWDFLHTNYGEEKGTELLNNLRAKGSYTVKDVEDLVTSHEKTRDLKEEEMTGIMKTLGEKRFKMFSDFLVAGNRRPSVDAYTEWVNQYNSQVEKDPTLIKVRTGLSKTVQNINGKTRIAEEEQEPVVASGANRGEVTVNTLIEAANSNGDLKNPAIRSGWETFVRQRGISAEDFNDPAKRKAFYDSYLKNVQAVKAAAPDGKAETLRTNAVSALGELLAAEGAAGLDKPENNWIVQSALVDKKSLEMLRQFPDMMNVLLNSPYGDLIRKNASEELTAQDMQKMIASGVIDENFSYAKEYNYTQYWRENGNNPTLASMAIFRDITKNTGFTDEEVRLVLEDDYKIARLINLSTGEYMETPEEIMTDDNFVSGNIINKVTLKSEAVKKLMNARKALSGGYTSLGDYNNAVRDNFSNAVRQVGSDAANLGNEEALKTLRSESYGTVGYLGNYFYAGLTKSLGQTAKSITESMAGLMDLTDIIAGSGTPFSKGSLERRLRDARMDDAMRSATEVTSRSSVSTESVARFLKDSATSGQIAAGIGEGVGMLVGMSPLMKVHSATFGASASIMAAGESVYSDDLGKTVRRMLWSALPFTVGRGTEAVVHTKLGEFIENSLVKLGDAAKGANKELISISAQNIMKDSSYLAGRHADKISMGIEELIQLPLPAAEALSEIYLTEKGKKNKRDYEAIKAGKEIVYPQGIVSEEDKEKYRQQVVMEYDELRADITAGSIVRDLMISASVPFFSAAHRSRDIETVSKARGTIKLLNDNVYSSLRNGEVEYSGYVQLPSGITEFMVLPSNLEPVKAAVTAKKVLPFEAATIDSLLLISRLANRVGSEAEYRSFGEKAAKAAEDFTAAANPLLTEQAKERMILSAEKSLRNEDNAAKKYISIKQAEAEALMRGMDEDAVRMIAEEQQKAVTKEKEVADRKSYIDEINAKLKDKSVSETDKVGLLEDRRTLLAEQVRESQFVPKESTQTDFSEKMLLVAQKVNADTKIGKDYGRPDQFHKAPSDQLLKDMADHLQDTPDAANDPRMKTSYEALKKETKLQYQSLVDQGFKFEAYKGEGEPYKNSSEMLADLRNNKHLYYFATESGFGREGETYNHPLMADSGLKDSAGNPMMENDVFRAVHDALGHGVAGVQFGARGEHNATISHSRNYSDKAIPALLSETSFQNAWVNYGKHLRSKKGDIPKKGEEGFIPATQRPFADQKVVNVTEGWIKRWKEESDLVGSETVQYSRKAYEDLSGRVEKGEVFSVKDLSDADQKRALARLVGEKKVFISDKGTVVPAKESANHPEFKGANSRKAELKSIDEAAKLLADIPESQITKAERVILDAQAVKKTEKGAETKVSKEKPSEALETSGKGQSLVGQTVKYKDSNRTVEVAQETANSVIDPEGNAVKKDLLDLPESKAPEAQEHIDVVKKGKINLQSDEFSPDNPNSVILRAKDNALVVNEAANRKLEEVIDADFLGLSLSKKEVLEVSALLDEAGYSAEAEAFKKASASLKGNQGLVVINGSNTRKGTDSVEFTSTHEFVHEQFRKAFKDFNKNVINRVEKSEAFQAVRKAFSKAGYTDIDSVDSIHEILAHGLTLDIGNIKKRGVTEETFAKAMADVVDALSREYSNKKVSDVVDAVLRDVEGFEEAVRLNAAVSGKAKETVKREAEKAGVKNNERQKIGQSKENVRSAAEEVRQAIAESNAPESFVLIENQPDYGQKGSGKPDAENAQIPGLKKIPEDKIYKSEDSELHITEREIPVMKEEEVKDFLKTDAASVKILDKGHQIKEGQKVGVRLNLNVLKSTGKMIQTLHNRNYNGEALDYQHAVTLKNASFNVNQKARELIASGQANKFPMASVDGEYVKTDSPDFSGIEIGFNPKVNHLFVDATGRPIKSAEEVVVVGSRAYARGKVEYYTRENMPEAVSPSNVKVDAPFVMPEAPKGLKKVRTDSENFKKWFGNSVIKDEQGNPRVLQHGTKSVRDFDEFSGSIIWASDDRGYHNYYNSKPELDLEAFDMGYAGARTMPVFMRAEKTFDSAKYMSNVEQSFTLADVTEMFRKDAGDISATEDQKYLLDRKIKELEDFINSDHEFNFMESQSEKPFFIWYNANPEIKEMMEILGYDSIRTIEGGDYEAFGVFSPNQIKSAIGNSGDFSIENMSILFKKIDKGGEVTVEDLAQEYKGVLTPEKAEFFGLKKVNTESEEFKRWHGNSKVKDVVYHGTMNDFEVFNRTVINQMNLGFHIGTLKQAHQFVGAEEAGTGANIMPLYIKAEKPLRLKDRTGGWYPAEIIKQLRDNPEFSSKELDDLFNELQEMNIPVTNLADREKQKRIVYQQNKRLIEFLGSKGYDSIEYVNRFEGLAEDIDADVLYFDDRAGLTDEEFQEKYGAELSYIIFEPTHIKSAISNSGEFSDRNMSILFKRREDDPEIHDITIRRLTRSGNPFTFTEVRGAEYRRRVAEGAEPVFNFFVKDEVHGYNFEVDFGRKDKPHRHYKQYETKGTFRLYDVYQDYLPGGRRLWAELGDAAAMKIIKEEGYDGFWNSNEDVSPTFRNRISLFDTEQNVAKVLSGDTSKQPDVDSLIVEKVTENNLSIQEEIRKVGLRSIASQTAEEMNEPFRNSFDPDLIDFENELDGIVVHDYVKSADSSLRRVAARNGMSYRAVRNILRKYDVPMNAQVQTAANVTLTPEQLDFAVKAYTSKVPGERKSLSQLANRFGVDKESIGRILREQGIEIDSAQVSSQKSAHLVYRSAKAANSRFESEKGEMRNAIDSSYELAYMSMLDRDNSVKSWTRDIDPISYKYNGRNYQYFPDFIVLYSDGRKVLAEVKPLWKIVDLKNKAKFEAAGIWAKENGYEFQIVTEFEIGTEGFAKTDLSRVIGDPEEIKRLKRSIDKASSESYMKNALKRLEKIKTESEKIKHSSIIQFGLKKILDEKGEVPVSDKEREASEKWIKEFKGQKAGSKYKDSDHLVFGEKDVDFNLVLESNAKGEDFIPSFLKNLEGKNGISIEIPKAITKDSELIEIALRGIAGKDWYSESYEVLKSFKENSLGKFLPESFVRLIGATGQGMAPRENFIMAAKYLNRMIAGTYGKDKKKADIERLKSTGILNGDGRYAIPASNISDAMNNIPLSSRKLGDYTEAFLGNPNKVVSDEWMNRLFTGLSGAPTPKAYDFIEGRVRHIARKLGLTPTQAQAVLWVGYKNKVGEFVKDQLDKLDKSEVTVSITMAYESMLAGGDFKTIADELGLQDRVIPEFPTALAVALYKDRLLEIVADKSLPKIEKGKSLEVKVPEGKAAAYYYDLNKPSAAQGRVVINPVKLNEFLDSDPAMTDMFASVYENVFMNTLQSKVPNRDLGMTGEAVFKAAYWKSKGADITKIDFNQKGITTLEKLKKLGMFKLDTSESEEIYFSKLRQVIDEKMPSSASVEQVKNIINNSSIRKEEAEWMGVQEFLEGKDKISKEDLQQFLELNKIQLEESIFGKVASDGQFFKIFDGDGNYVQKVDDLLEAERIINEPGNKGWHFRAEFNKENAGRTAYGSYVLGGEDAGKNYKEFLLRMPVDVEAVLPKNWTIEESEFGYFVMNKARGTSVTRDYRTRQEAIEEALEYVDGATIYKSSHWQQKNVIAHFRGDERYTEEGLRTFHAAEFQSDLHQQGRKEGYQIPIDSIELPEGAKTFENYGRWSVEFPAGSYQSRIIYGKTEQDAIHNAKKYISEIGMKGGKRVPDFPFKKNWHELAFRRALKYAVDSGFDAFSWNTGDQNSEIFGLVKHVKKIDIYPDLSTLDENQTNASITFIEGQSASFYINKVTGIIENASPSRFKSTEGKLFADVVGKSIADQVINAANKETIEGKGLNIGGEGMRGFYDKMLVDYAGKFVKKYGGKVEKKKVSGQETAYTLLEGDTLEQKKKILVEQFKKKSPVFVEYDRDGVKRPVHFMDVALGHLMDGEELYIADTKGVEGFVSGDQVMDWLFQHDPEKLHDYQYRTDYWRSLSQPDRDGLIDDFRSTYHGEEVWTIAITPEMRSAIYKKPVALFKKKTEAQRVADLKNLDFGEWIDLATEISSNGVITTKEVQDIQDLVNSKDLDGLQKYVANLNREGLLEFLSSMRRAGLLTGIKTSARNIISNTAFQALEEIARVPASVIDIALSTVAKKERTIQGLSPVALTRALVKASTEGLKGAARTMVKGDNYFSMDDVHVAREKTTGYKVLKPFEAARNLVFRAMGAQDNIFRSFAEERAKYELAWLKAKANKTNVGTEYANLDITDLDKAAYAASVAVFQNDNKLNKAYQNWKGDRSEAIKFMLDLKLPFVKTPSNIFDRILDYSGIWGLVKIADSDKQKIKNVISDPETRRAFQFAVAKGMTGLAIMTLGYGMYQNGMLYGFQDETDQSLKKAQELENSGAGHMLIAGKWRDISSLSPLATLFQMGATYARQKELERQALAEDRKTASEKAVNYSKILLNIAQASPFIKAGADTISERTYASPFSMENLAPVDSLVPSIVSEIAQLTDNVKRSTATEEGSLQKLVNKTKARIPGLRQTLPAQKDAVGNDREQPMGMDPFSSKTDRGDKLSDETKRLNYNLPTPKRKEGESYSSFNSRKQEQGGLVSEILKKVVEDQAYAQSPDAVRKNILQAAGKVNKDLSADERLHNAKVALLRESSRKELTDELLKMPVSMTDEERKRIITNLFSKASVTKNRKLQEAQESYSELKKNLKSALMEAVENFKERKEEEEEEEN